MSDEVIFTEALGIPAGPARLEYLDRVCADDTSLRREVEGLLAAHTGNEEFLESPANNRANGNDGTLETVDYREILKPSDRADSLGRIGHYEVLEVLGRGGFGIVYRAFDDKLQRVVALKVLSPTIAATSPARKRFIREARAAAQVRHEYVVQIYSVEEEHLPYLVMEYIPGETLQQRLDRTGPLDVVEIVRIGRQTAEGLAEAHAQGLIHRDIKPANLLIEAGARPRVKITDFGLARAADDACQTQSGILAGTPQYMAPEQARGETLDHRADLFSLGSVLYVAATGRPPFRARSTFAVLKRVVEDTPRPIGEIIPELPVWLAELIARLHAKNAADRFQSAREVAGILADCEAQLQARGEVGAVSFPPRRIAAAKISRRWKWAAAVALLLTALSLAALEAAGVTTLIRPRETTTQTTLPSVDPSPASSAPVLRQSLTGHRAKVSNVVYSPDGLLLASAGPGMVRIWDAKGGTLRHTIDVTPVQEYNAISFTPDGKRLLTAQVASWGTGDISIWNTDTGKSEGVMEGHRSGVFEIAVAADGTVFSAGWDNTIRVWNLAERREVRSIPLASGHFARSVVALPGGLLAASCNGVHIVKTDGSPVRTMAWDAAQLAYSPNSQRLAGAIWTEGKVVLWNPETGEETASWQTHNGPANGVAFSRDGSILVTAGNDGKVRLWEVATRGLLAELSHDGAAIAVAFAPDGLTLASTGADQVIKLWDVSGVVAGRK